MDTYIPKIELQKKMVDIQLKQQKDITYLRILKSLGIITIVIAMIMTIMKDLYMTPESWTLYGMGIFLFLTGFLWQEKNKKEVNILQERIDDLENKEIESHRISYAN